MRIYNITDYERGIENAPSVVGNKAAALFKNMAIANIPKFCVLDAPLLSALLSVPENSAVKDQLLEIWACKTNLISLAPKIRRLFQALKIPPLWEEHLEEYLEKHNIAPPYAVRSSSILEDTTQRSGAGAYDSFLNVEKDELWAAIKDCLCSIFMPNALNLMDDDLHQDIFSTMAVIIQEMIESEISGVIFTKHPVDPEKGMLIEYASHVGAITDGRSEVRSLTVKDNLILGAKSNLKWLQDLISTADTLRQENNNAELDIEWGMKDNEIYIFQLRAITTSNTNNDLYKNRLMKINDLVLLPKNGLLSLAGKYESWRYKKALLYSLCERNGIRALEWYILIAAEREGLEVLCQEAAGKLSSDYVLVMYNDIIIDWIVKKSELNRELTALFKRKGERPTAFSLREMRENSLSAISSYNMETDTVLIEAFPGAMMGLKSGLKTPARYLVGENGLLEQSIPAIDNFYSYNIEQNKMEIVTYNSQELLSEAHAMQIYDSTKKLYLGGMKGALEWWICDNEPIVTDISLELSGKPQLHAMNEISSGAIMGTVLEITDLTGINELSYSNAISVKNYDQSITGISKIADLIAEIKRRKKMGQRVLLKMEKPFLALAPVLEEVDGVIFKEASILCHLSIILREKGIPAVAVGNQYDYIKKGDEISL